MGDAFRYPWEGGYHDPQEWEEAALQAEEAERAALARLAAAEAALREAREEVRRYEDFSNEVVARAGDEWDGDDDQETIAIRYVRHLEAAVAARDVLLDQALELTTPHMRVHEWGICMAPQPCRVELWRRAVTEQRTGQ